MGRYPSGNVLLSFAVLLAGASISKDLLVFQKLLQSLDIFNLLFSEDNAAQQEQTDVTIKDIKAEINELENVMENVTLNSP